MKNKYVPCNNSDVVKKKNINKTLSTTVSSSTKGSSLNGKDDLTSIIFQEEKNQKVKVESLEINNDDVIFNNPKSLKEKDSENEIYQLLRPNQQLKDSQNQINLNSPSNDENLSSTNSRPREDSITTDIRESLQSPNNTDTELNKFFSPAEEEKQADDSIIENLSAKQILERGMQYKIRANSLFKKNKFRDSLVEYLKAVDDINLLLSNRANQGINVTNINWLKLECLNNIAVCYLLMKEFNQVLSFTEQVLKVNPNNVNSLYYRAKAFISLGVYKEAGLCLKKALSIKYSKRIMTLLKDIEGKMEESVKARSLSIDEEMNANKFRDSEDKNNEHDGRENLNSKSESKSHSDLSEKNSKNETNEKNLKNGFEKNGSNSLLQIASNKHTDKKSKKTGKKSFFFSVIYTIIKFSKIMSIGVLEFLRRHKYGIIILIVIWIITFRTSFKNKLLNMLKIRFN